MVKKLFKHEFWALGRIILPAGFVVVVMGLLASLSFLLQRNDATATYFSFLTSIFVVFFAMAMIAFFILTFILCSVRFYSSMYGKEGYMTFSLPVTPGQLLTVKTLTAVVMLLYAFLVSLAALELFSVLQGLDVVKEIFGKLMELFLKADTPSIGLIVMSICALVIAPASSLLYVFACMSAGQLFSKNRGLYIVIVYIVANQAIGIVFSIIQTVIMLSFRNVTDGYIVGYIMLSSVLVQEIAVATASVLFTCWIIKNKVNLLA